MAYAHGLVSDPKQGSMLHGLIEVMLKSPYRGNRTQQIEGGARGNGGVGGGGRGSEIILFPDPAFTKDKGLAHFARNIGLADSALPEIWKTNILADHVVRIALPKRTLKSCD